MASAVASKGVPPLAVFLKELLAAPNGTGMAAAAARRVFISKLLSDDSSEDSSGNDSSDKDSSDEDADAAAAARRCERSLALYKLFSGDLLDEASKMRLLLALPEVGDAASRTGSSPRGWWVSKEDGDTVQLKVAMPGLAKEHVKMKAEKDVLVIKGEGDEDSGKGDSDKGSARYSYRIVLSSQAFKMDQIKVEMNNGMLMVTVPKIKDEERKDVFEIKVE